MNTGTLVNVVDVIERHTRAMLSEIRTVVAGVAPAIEPAPELHSPAPAVVSPAEAWRETGRFENQTYSWPPDAGGDEEYDPFVTYRSAGMTLALAHNKKPVWIKDKPRRQIWVFQLGARGGSKRPITPFIAADDYDTSHEFVAIIRGNGETGRAMYGPSDRLPSAYAELKVEILGDRVEGHYNKYAVVAHEDDVESMLRHGAAQIRLRGW